MKTVRFTVDAAATLSCAFINHGRPVRFFCLCLCLIRTKNRKCFILL